MEVKCFKLLVDRIRGVYILDPSIDLESVIVHDYYQIVQVSVSCEHGSLPDLSFLDLAVTEKRVHTVGSLIQLSGNSHTYCRGDALSQRT